MARRSDVITPKLSFPFELAASGKYAKVVEQDSDEEIEACIAVLVLTVEGSRQEVPRYGVPDQTFREGGVSREAILSAIRVWEGRANVDLTAQEVKDLVQRVQIHYLGRLNG